jgi:hypothetical protein
MTISSDGGEKSVYTIIRYTKPLTNERFDKGKPAERRGRKARGLVRATTALISPTRPPSFRKASNRTLPRRKEAFVFQLLPRCPVLVHNRIWVDYEKPVFPISLLVIELKGYAGLTTSIAFMAQQQGLYVRLRGERTALPRERCRRPSR